MPLALYIALLLAASPHPGALAEARAAFPEWTITDTERGFVVATPGARGHERAVAIVRDAVSACEDFMATRSRETWTAFVLPDRPTFVRFVEARYPPELRADWITSGTYGFADPARRWIVVDHGPGPGTLAHEVLHPLVRADFPAAPVWLDEGLAALFEHKRYVDGRVEGLVSWRMETLRAHAGALTIVDVMTTDRLAFWSRGDVMMAASRHLIVWLQRRGWWPSFYRAFRSDPAMDPTGRRHLEALTGETLEALDRAWKRWIRTAR